MIGAGVVGAATARALAEAGSRVLLLEAFGRGHDRGSSHGATRIFRHGYAEADYVAMTVAARDGWRKLERASGRTLLDATGSTGRKRTAGGQGCASKRTCSFTLTAAGCVPTRRSRHCWMRRLPRGPS